MNDAIVPGIVPLKLACGRTLSRLACGKNCVSPGSTLVRSLAASAASSSALVYWCDQLRPEVTSRNVDELNVWTTNLGWFLVSAVHAYAPEVVILTGGGAHGARHFLKPPRAHVNRHLFRWPVGEPLPIVVSKMIDHAGVLGAAAQAWLFV